VNAWSNHVFGRGINPTARSCERGHGLINYGKVTPVQLAQSQTYPLTAQGWMTGNIMLDPAIVAGVVMNNTVSIYDDQNSLIFTHTFRQAFTINIANARVSKIVLAESTTATYTVDFIYQLVSYGPQDQLPAAASISYVATAPFVTPKALGTGTFGTFQTTLGSIASGANSQTITLPTGFNGYAIILVSVNNINTAVTFSAPTIDGSGTGVTLQLTNAPTTAVNSSPWAIVSWNGGSLSGSHTFGFTSSGAATVTACYIDVFYSTEAVNAVSNYHTGTTNTYTVGSGTIGNPFSSGSAIQVAYYLEAVASASSSAALVVDTVLDNSSNPLANNQLANITSTAGAIRQLSQPTFLVNVVTTTSAFKNALSGSTSLTTGATGWCVVVYVITSITVQP